MLSDATKSVSRAYINNFQDKSKQIAIDMFLARPVPALSTDLLISTRRVTSAINNLSRYSTQFTTQFGLRWNNGTPLAWLGSIALIG